MHQLRRSFVAGRLTGVVLVLLSVGTSLTAAPQQSSGGTFSVVAWDSATGEMGVALESQLLGAGGILSFAKGGTGAFVVSSAPSGTTMKNILDLLSNGVGAQRVVESLEQSDSGAGERQFIILDAHGSAAGHTGVRCGRTANHLVGNGFAVQSYGISTGDLPNVLAAAYAGARGDMAERLFSALEAGEKASRLSQGWRSASLLIAGADGVFGAFNDRMADIRVDDDPVPLVKLHALYTQWQSSYLVEARLQAIDQLNQARQFDQAHNMLTQLVDMFNIQLRSRPDDPALLNSLAWTLATHDIDAARALELSQRAVKLDPGRNDFLNTEAECYFRLKRYDDAILIGADLVAKEPSSDKFWRQLAKFREAKSGK
jgi:uncharacterized Ntn-hydrolase superfamily protein